MFPTNSLVTAVSIYILIAQSHSSIPSEMMRKWLMQRWRAVFEMCRADELATNHEKVQLIESRDATISVTKAEMRSKLMEYICR